MGRSPQRADGAEGPFADPTPNIEQLLAEIDADPTCLFWG
jgi:hypothetical protein